jgi:hypothetical protein
MNEKQLYLRVLLRYLSFGCILTAIAFMYVFKVLSPRDLGIAMVASLVIFFIFTLVMQRRDFKAYWKAREWPEHSIDATVRKRRIRTIRRLTFSIVFLHLVLWYGLWETRGQSLPPRLVGATMNLLFTGLMIQAVIRIRQSLRLPDPPNWRNEA